MPYWGNKPAENDFAFDTVGSYVYLIKERMFKEMVDVVEKRHPEQGIVASLTCIRKLAQEFPKCVQVHFGKREFGRCKALFTEWYSLASKKIPAAYRDAVLREASAEFSLFEAEVLKK
jgi:hypothetical protein